uniref:hypothetical protein n=1 Tax=Alistipes shahii TaxID=328814 RepID=UPI003AAAB0C1
PRPAKNAVSYIGNGIFCGPRIRGFVIKIRHFVIILVCRCVFLRKRVYLRSVEIYDSDRMQERIQLALILLLFALAGSLEDTSFRSGAESVRPALTQSSVAGSHAAACNYFSAAICPCAVSIEAPAAPSDHKAAVRQLAGARVACDAAFGLRTAMRTYSPALHPDAVDYYVFSLGRILI